MIEMTDQIPTNMKIGNNYIDCMGLLSALRHYFIINTLSTKYSNIYYYGHYLGEVKDHSLISH